METTHTNPHLALIDDLAGYGHVVDRGPWRMIDLGSALPGVHSIRLWVSTEDGEDTNVYAFANPHGLIAWEARFSASVSPAVVMAAVEAAAALTPTFDGLDEARMRAVDQVRDVLAHG